MDDPGVGRCWLYACSD